MDEERPGRPAEDRARFRFLLEGTPDGVLIVDPGGRVLHANAQAHTLFGYRVPELEGLGVESLIPHAQRQRHTELRGGYQSGPRPRRMNAHPRLPALRKDGEERWIDVGLAPLEVDGRTLVSVTVRDATERARAATKAGILDAAQEGIWVLDARGKTTFVNRVLSEMLGYRVDELDGGPYPRVVDPADRALATRLVEGDDGTRAPARGELRLRTRTGACRWVILVASPLRAAPKQPPSTLVMVTEITDRHDAEAALRENQQDLERMVQEVRALNEALERRVAERTAELEAFCHAVTHDLRASISSISSFCELLLEEDSGADGAGSSIIVTRIHANARRLDELVGGLTGMTRLDQQPSRWELVDLAALAREIVAELVMASPDREIDLHIGSASLVHGDPRQLRLALDNLLRNAWKFTAGCIAPRIEFGTLSGSEGPVWFVRDNGAGFDPEDQHRLFQPFERLHARRHFHGTGLGLVTVHRVIERHGGRVWAEGRPGEGATFYFTLGAPPRTEEEARV